MSSPHGSNAAHDFEALLQPHLKVAYATAFRMLGSREEAEDVVQEAAVRAWRAFDSFEPGTHFKAWFLKIVMNLALNAQRSRSRRPEAVSIDESDETTQNFLFEATREAGWHHLGQDPAKMLLDKLHRNAIQVAIDRLPPDFRSAAVLFFVDDFSYEQIAEMLGCPLGTVRSRLFRARRLLQKELWDVGRDMGLIDGEAAKIEPAKPARKKFSRTKAAQCWLTQRTTDLHSVMARPLFIQWLLWEKTP